MGSICCVEMSVTNYQLTPRNITEERQPQMLNYDRSARRICDGQSDSATGFRASTSVTAASVMPLMLHIHCMSCRDEQLAR
jgi:hypothetical protein